MSISTFNELQTAIGNWVERDDLINRIPEFITLAESRLRREVRIREMQTRFPLLASSSATITDITNANPAVVTAAAHGFANGDNVYLQDILGMVELNERRFTVANKTTNTFELSGEDSSAHTAYSSGGNATLTKVNGRFSVLPSDFLSARTVRLLTDPVTVLKYVDPHEMNRERDEDTGKPTLYTIHEDMEFNVSADQAYDGEMIYWKRLEPLSAINTTNILLDRDPSLYLYASLMEASLFIMDFDSFDRWSRLYTDAKNQVNETAKKANRVSPMVAKIKGGIV